jgi:alkanesulfonate monooxygenase SsuD/methylene tetrahydromethanopterin reductase-like flavin-dependent oxidoreductase (luciferase family)
VLIGEHHFTDDRFIPSPLIAATAVAARTTKMRVATNSGHFDIDGATLTPLPVQQPHPPVWGGGTSRPALRRAARDAYTGPADPAVW